MKRIKAACVEKTIHFQLKEGLDAPSAIQEVRSEVARYKNSLDRNRTRYRILSETTEPDGSILIQIKMQYNNAPVGHYLD